MEKGSLQLRVLHILQSPQGNLHLSNPVPKDFLTEVRGANRAAQQTKAIWMMGMSDGRGDLGAMTSSGVKRRDLLQLRWRPRESPSLSMMWSAAVRSSGEPTKVSLSRYRESDVVIDYFNHVSKCYEHLAKAKSYK